LHTILEASEQIRRRAISPVDLTRDCLARIEKLDPILNAFITVTAEQALSAAKIAEEEIRRGDWRGPLHGIPIGLKDLIDTAGVRTTGGSAVFKDRVPSEDAEVVRRLKAAGAILIGKHNLHEFAYGGSSVVSYFGEVHNPWDTACVAGGSSGGSAAAVACGLGFAAIGTDTAGSIRLPASCCGVVGLKPTYGRVSARGVIPLSWSLDHVGPIATSVTDAAIMLQAIAGYDPQDTCSVDRPLQDWLAATLAPNTRSLRLGIPRDYFFADLDPEIAAAAEQALGVLEALKAELQQLSIPVDVDRTLQSAESFAYHAVSVATSPELYQPETLRRIRSGAEISATDYIHARRKLDETRCKIQKVFAEVDLLVMPTTPISPPKLAELKENPELLRPREITMLRNTRPVNIWGLPAISLPCGFTSAGLPMGLQIVGPPWREDLVLQLAYVYEQATAWHKRTPSAS
jgi:aspartyl-tRNA(Asn)/glutamyl-tRNA(Gln) amidotransferase subunit A